MKSNTHFDGTPSLPIDYAGDEPEQPYDVEVSNGEWLALAMIMALVCAIGFVLGFGVASWIN